MNNQPNQPHVCVHCGTGYTTNRLLRMHLGRHYRVLFTCPHCVITPYSTTSSNNFIQHMATHTGAPRQGRARAVARNVFTCRVCHSAFVTPAGLVAHRSNAHQPTIYSCFLCRRRFTNRVSYAAHRLTHVAIAQFACSRCGSIFTTSILFARHYHGAH